MLECQNASTARCPRSALVEDEMPSGLRGAPGICSEAKRCRSVVMSDATLMLAAIERGDPKAAEQLLALVYDELRRLAAYKMAQQAPGQTLQPTALVHEE